MPKPLAWTSIDESSLSSKYRGRLRSRNRILSIILLIKLNISTHLTSPHDVFFISCFSQLLSLTRLVVIAERPCLLSYSLVSLLTQEVWRNSPWCSRPGSSPQDTAVPRGRFRKSTVIIQHVNSLLQATPQLADPMRSIFPVGIWKAI